MRTIYLPASFLYEGTGHRDGAITPEHIDSKGDT